MGCFSPVSDVEVGGIFYNIDLPPLPIDSTYIPFGAHVFEQNEALFIGKLRIRCASQKIPLEWEDKGLVHERAPKHAYEINMVSHLFSKQLLIFPNRKFPN